MAVANPSVIRDYSIGVCWGCAGLTRTTPSVTLFRARYRHQPDIGLAGREPPVAEAGGGTILGQSDP